ncbi:MAG: hypothetical protein JNK79_04990 [Chitinophagaceae bacterium]|nr:hypothetical protein [Chitinophagaceae bacterium]
MKHSQIEKNLSSPAVEQTQKEKSFPFLTGFIHELNKRNPTLFWYGILNLFAALICIILIQTTTIEVNNINAFIKPLKFFISIAIFCFTVGWIFHYLQLPRKVRAYNIMAVIVFTFESFVITWQAANGRLSHFNTTTPLYGVLFSLMGIAIVVLTLWTGYFGVLFFRRKEWNIPMPYVWGIRLGILFFVVFALEGGVMARMLQHTVGGDDGGKGLPLVNWNREHGDLRIAHFLGMHTLQIFPLFGYFIAKSSRAVKIFAAVYAGLVSAVLIQALMGLPLL